MYLTLIWEDMTYEKYRSETSFSIYFVAKTVERWVQEFGSNFELTSEPEKGTSVLISIPRINTHQ
ncbi:MAG: hypothetical protein K1X82_06980 [Bacteroidia bacterium]|nr:hypothetical protein [Bacteroidia bacterium]